MPLPHPETKPLPHPETKPLPHPETKPLSHPETKSLPHSETKPRPHPETKPLSHPETKPLPHPETKPLPHPETKTLPHSETKPLLHPETNPLSHPETKPLPHPETKPLPHPETMPLNYNNHREVLILITPYHYFTHHTVPLAKTTPTVNHAPTAVDVNVYLMSSKDTFNDTKILDRTLCDSTPVTWSYKRARLYCGHVGRVILVRRKSPGILSLYDLKAYGGQLSSNQRASKVITANCIIITSLQLIY